MMDIKTQIILFVLRKIIEAIRGGGNSYPGDAVERRLQEAEEKLEELEKLE